MEVKQRDHANLRGEVSTITVHMEQKEEKERLARERVETLEVSRETGRGGPGYRLFVRGATFLPGLTISPSSRIMPMLTSLAAHCEESFGRFADTSGGGGACADTPVPRIRPKIRKQA